MAEILRSLAIINGEDASGGPGARSGIPPAPQPNPSTFDTAGAYVWGVPLGVTTATFEIWGASGDGRAGSGAGGGPGGGGGAYCKVTATGDALATGGIVSISVSSRRQFGSTAASTVLTFPDSDMVGAGAGRAAGGAGGAAGTVTAPAGPDVTVVTSTAGSAGSAADGDTGGAGGNAGSVGTGGAGGVSGSPGVAGVAPGGGGGGGGKDVGTATPGGAGTAGKVVISW